MFSKTQELREKRAADLERKFAREDAALEPLPGWDKGLTRKDLPGILRVLTGTA